MSSNHRDKSVPSAVVGCHLDRNKAELSSPTQKLEVMTKMTSVAHLPHLRGKNHYFQYYSSPLIFVLNSVLRNTNFLG